MSLHIGIDGSCLTPRKAGIGFYLARLLQALDQLPGGERYTIFSNKEIPYLGLSQRFDTDVLKIPSTTLWAQTFLRFRLRRRPVDLFHSASIGMPLFWRRIPTILTIHDLAFLHFPRQKDLLTKITWPLLVPRLIRQSTHLLANSEFTKADVVDHLGIAESKITPTPLAADPAFCPIPDKEDLRRFRRDQGIERDYILCVGTLEPRKNLPFLMRCFAACVRNERIDGDLIIVGGEGWLYDEILETRRSLALSDRIKLVGYVKEVDDLRRYYAACRFFVYPSLFEGFGMPCVEAMSCGVPVIASNRGSLPEVVGEGGLLLDPQDAAAWEETLGCWWNSPDLSVWKERAQRQAAKFSWQRTAEKTLEVYRQVAGEDSR